MSALVVLALLAFKKRDFMRPDSLTCSQVMGLASPSAASIGPALPSTSRIVILRVFIKLRFLLSKAPVRATVFVTNSAIERGNYLGLVNFW